MNQVIVQVVQHLRPGGIETMALDLLTQLEPQADIHIFSLEGEKKAAINAWPRLANVADKLHFFEKPQGLDFQLTQALSHKLKQLNAETVHTHHIGPMLYAGLAAKCLGITHIHTEHDSWHLKHKSNLYLQRALIKLLRPILVADCPEVAEALTRHIPSAKPKVILNGVDIHRFYPPTKQQKLAAKKCFKLPASALIIGCAARLELVKGHSVLFKALSKAHPDIHLVLAGDGSLKHHLEDLAEKMGLQNRITFLGNLNDIVPFYHAIDLFCLPSLNEGFPLSPLEAQACGVPAIVSDVGGCKNTVCPDTGTAVPPGEVAPLQEAILRFYEKSQPGNPRLFVLGTGSLERTALSYFQLMKPSGGLA